jgi:hypothetical protein
MSKSEKTLVTTSSLKTLLAWCEDAIDFRDESDADAAAAFETLYNEMEQSILI